jgi:phosphomannomutase
VSPPRFGTDGWRAEIARGFTLANVRAVVQAIASHLVDRGGRTAAVGYDRRFLARRFAHEAAGVLLGNGLAVRMSDRPEPTPALSCEVVTCGADFGLMITASHNPPEFLGLKIKTAAGASAPPEVTAGVERRLGREPVRFLPPEQALAMGRLSLGPFGPAHLACIGRVVDLGRLAAAGLRVAVDVMHGSGGRILEELFEGTPTRIDTLRWEVDPLFGGQAPEPTRDRMGPLLRRMAAGSYALGFATDGDADRIAAADEAGAFVSPLRLIGVLALHMVRRRGTAGGIAKTFANTVYLDRIAAAEGRPFHCLPVGFKHVAALLERGELAIGGEESGGIGVAGYLPERDGLLAGLLLMEAVALSGKPLSGLLRDLVEEFGDYHYDRRDLHLPSGAAERLEGLRRHPPDRVGGVRVEAIDALDGIKMLLGDEGWLLLRASGTEPVVRVYAEALSPERVAALLDDGARLAGAGP